MRSARLLIVSQHAVWPGGVPARGVPAWRGVPARGDVPARGVPTWGVYLLGDVPAGGVPAQVLPPPWTE